MPEKFKRGEMLTASLVLSDQKGVQRQPVLVLRHGSDGDLLVLPVASQ
jgi:hypothetical protein